METTVFPFFLDREMTVEYDKDGRFHYVPKNTSRSTSRDHHDDNDFLSYDPDNCENSSTGELHFRTSSTGKLTFIKS